MSKVCRSWILVAFVPIVGSFAAPVHAQSSFELTPLFAYYQPIGNFGPRTREYFSTLPTNASDLSGAAWGAEARVWIDRRLGAQLQAAVANGIDILKNAIFTPGGTVEGPTQAQVLVATAQALYDLAPSAADYRFLVSAGPSMVRHGGNAYAPWGSPVNVGGALGIAVDLPVGPRLRLTLGAESLLYSLHINDSQTKNSVEDGVQDDLLLHVGLVWRVR